LPGLDGLDVTRSLRRNGAVPIIMLTARADESDKLVGLELGADDYLTKPFSPKELVARVRSVLRRTEAAREPADLIRLGDVELNVPSMQLTISGRRVDLTPTEFQLLATMVRQPGRVFSRAQLLSAVRGVAFESYERAIDAHIKNLRRKIEPDPHNPRYLLTVFGVGYRFADLRRCAAMVVGAGAGAGLAGAALVGADRGRRRGGRRARPGHRPVGPRGPGLVAASCVGVPGYWP